MKIYLKKTIIWILTALLVLTGTLAAVNMLRPRSPLDAYDFTDCQISVSYSSIYGDYGRIAFLEDAYRLRVLSLLEAAKIDPKPYAEDYILDGGSNYQYEFLLTGGESIYLGFFPASPRHPRESGALGDLVIDGKAYECYTWIDCFADVYQNEVNNFNTLRSLAVAESGSFPKFSALRLIDLAAAETVMENAFRDTDILEQVRFGEGLLTIRAGAFLECDNLKEVYFKGDPETLESGIFNSGVTVYGLPGGAVEAYAEAEGLTFLPLPETIPPLT